MFGGSSQLPTLLSELNSTIWFDYRALGSSRKLEGTAEHLIDGSEKCICRLRFEFKSPYVIEKRSKILYSSPNFGHDDIIGEVGTNDIMASQKSGDWQNARINIILKKT